MSSVPRTRAYVCARACVRARRDCVSQGRGTGPESRHIIISPLRANRIPPPTPWIPLNRSTAIRTGVHFAPEKFFTLHHSSRIFWDLERSRQPYRFPRFTTERELFRNLRYPTYERKWILLSRYFNVTIIPTDPT